MRYFVHIIFLSIFSILCSISEANAQSINQEDFKNLSFRNIGPAGMSGRVTAIDVDLSNKARIYVGSASGGLWLTENGGITWEPLFDDQKHLSIGSVKINQNNPAEIWVGTGEGNPRNSLNTGGGVYKSVDGGNSWTFMGLEKTRVIHRICINPNNTDEVILGVTGAPWGDSTERGVYKTTDGGKTWNKTLYKDQRTGVADMVQNPNNPNHIIAAMWDHRRTPWDFVSGGKGSGMHVSYDFGSTWKEITSEDGLPKGDLGRIGLAFATNVNNIVYALVEAKTNGLYKSTDGGEDWSLVSEKNIGNRPFYYSEIYVDPQNENRIYNLWSYVSKSEDGGKTFETIMDYGNNVHPDHHAFWIDPINPSYLIDGNDGGLNISRDRGESWHFVANLPIGQFYHVNIDRDFPYHVYGGMQDNGSWIGPGFVLKRGGIRNNDWQELYFGDGFDVSARPSDSRYGYAMSQGGNLGYYDRVTGKTRFVKPTADDSTALRYNWNAPLAQDPFNDCGIYYGSQFVHYSDDCGLSWKQISGDLTTNDTTKQKQDISGGLTIDATNAENHTTLISIAPSPVDANVIWTGSDDGLLHITTDGGDNWKEVGSRLSGLPKGSWLPQIEVSTKNAGEAFIVANDYRRNNYSAYAYHTTNYGQTWRRIVDDQKVGGFALSIIQDPSEENLLFLGTDNGLYVSFDKGNKWTHWTEGFPNVQITDLKIQPDHHDLVIGTFGRSLWVLDDIRPLQEIARTSMKCLDSDFEVFRPVPAYLVSNRSYDGIRFVAQGEFIGDNKGLNANFNFWRKPMKDESGKSKDESENSKEESKESDDKKDDKYKKDKIYVTIYDIQGDTIRNFSIDAKESGLQSVTWYLEKNGQRFPTRRKIKEDADPRGGSRVLPGTYKATFRLNGHIDSTMIDVKLDPRDNMTEKDIEAISIAQTELTMHVKRAFDAFESLKDMKSKHGVIKSMMTAAPDTTQDQINEWLKDSKKEIARLEKLYMMPEDIKGIQRNPNDLNSVLGSASYYINSSWGRVDENARRALDKAINMTNDVVGEVEKYKNGEFSDMIEKIKALALDPLSE